MPPAAEFVGSIQSALTRSILCGQLAKYNKMKHAWTKAVGTVPPSPAGGGRAAVRHVQVDEEGGEGQRLDNFLMRQCKGVPKSHLYQLIRSGQVRINGRRCRPDERLSVGDLVRVPPLVVGARDPAQAAAAPPAQFPVLFEDDVLLAIDKPAGVAVHGGSGVAHGVIERLRAARPEARFLELAHRLDRETSGVLLIGKKRQALLALHAQLRERVTDKRYRAIVVGRWPLRTKTVQHPLRRYLTDDGERRVRVQAGGQAAITRVTGLRQFELPGVGEFTLVEACIETGRTHQIRVHLAHSGFPIVGDDKYGNFELNKALEKLGYKGMFLHAFSISFRHPVEGRALRVEAPLPAAFERFSGAGRRLGGGRDDALADGEAHDDR